MLTAAAAKRHISLCGCVHHFILAVSLFDRQYTILIEKNRQVAYTGFYTVLEYLETVTGGESK